MATTWKYGSSSQEKEAATKSGVRGQDPSGSEDDAQTKICPRCGAKLFADMDVCYDCLYDFTRAHDVIDGFPQVDDIDEPAQEPPSSMEATTPLVRTERAQHPEAAESLRIAPRPEPRSAPMSQPTPQPARGVTIRFRIHEVEFELPLRRGDELQVGGVRFSLA